MAGRRSQIRVPAAFPRLAGDMRVIARLLNDYLREWDVDVPGSLAMDEYGDESDFADDQITHPVGHVILQAQRGLSTAADHMLGVAACIEAEDVIFATMSLLRPIVTATGTSYHLLDPDIGLRERLRRGWNLELNSLREQLNSLNKQNMPQAWERTAIARHQYLVWGRHHGYEQHSKKDRNGETRYWLADGSEDKQPPTDMRLAEAVLAAVGDGSLGHAVYRFTSAFIHSQPHAFSLFQRAENQFDPETPYAVPLGVSYEDLATWVLVTTQAVFTAASRCGHYFGGDWRKWNQTVDPILSRWAEGLRPE